MCYCDEMSSAQINAAIATIVKAGFKCENNKPLSPEAHGFLITRGDFKQWVSVENDSEAVITRDFKVFNTLEQYLNTL